MPHIFAHPQTYASALALPVACDPEELRRRACTLRERASLLLSVGYAKAARVLEDRASLLDWEAGL